MKRKKPNLLRKRVKNAILSLLEKWNLQGYNPRSINCGNCDAFSAELEKLFPNGTAMWGDQVASFFPKGIDPDGHCFFYLDGFFYDSECPEGVTSPHLLPYYQRDIELSMVDVASAAYGGIKISEKDVPAFA